MTTRRVLVVLVGLLTVFILVGGLGLVGVAGLAYFRLSGQSGGEQLYVVDGERRLRLLDADGGERVLAEDLSGDVFRYPAPAPGGERVAFISQDSAGVALNSLNLRSGERTELYRSASAPPLYITWSPDGGSISFLVNRPQGGLEVFIVPSDGSAEPARIGSTAGSSYFAWQPDGERLLLHQGGTRMEGGTVAIFERGDSQPSSELDDPGFFQAPAWSVDGDSFFYVVQPPVDGPMTQDRVESVLTRVSADGGAPQALASEQRNAILFSRSPASDDIAYITAGPDGFGGLKVVDAAGGEARLVSAPGHAIPAFFWSPDGSQLAYLTFEPQPQGLPRLTWHVVSRGGGEVRELSSFTPSPAFAGVINFFDAYALSLDLWSPDGTRIVYGTDAGVYVVDVATGEAAQRAEGSLAMWAKQ
jgi:TolB protein